MANLILNPSFETVSAGPDWDNWAEDDQGGQQADETSITYSGSHAVKLICTDVGENAWVYQDISVSDEVYYTLTFYTRGDGTYSGRYRIQDITGTPSDIQSETNTGITGTNYTKVTKVFKTPVSCDTIRIFFISQSTATGAYAYFDSASLELGITKEISSTTRLANLDNNKSIKSTAKFINIYYSEIGGFSEIAEAKTKSINSIVRLFSVQPNDRWGYTEIAEPKTKTINSTAKFWTRVIDVEIKLIDSESRLISSYIKSIKSTTQLYQDVFNERWGYTEIAEPKTKTINSTAKFWTRIIGDTYTKTINSTARFYVYNSNTNDGYIEVYDTYTKDSISSTARFVDVYIKSIESNPRLVDVFIKSIHSTALFLQLGVNDTYTKTINSTARLFGIFPETIKATAKLWYNTVLDIESTSRLVDTLIKSIKSTAKLWYIPINSINSTAKFVEYNVELDAINSTARLTTLTESTSNQFMTFYALSNQTTWTEGTPVISGVEQSKPCIPVKNMPNFNVDMNIIHNRKQNCLSTYHTDEFNQGVKYPNSTWEFDGNSYNLANIMWSLFQNGAGENSDYLKIFKAYTSSNIETSLTLLRKVYDLSFVTQKYQRIIGAVCKTLVLSHESGGLLNASAEFVGNDFESDYNLLGDVIGFSEKDPLKFGYTFQLNNIWMHIQSWNIEITNNAVLKYAEAQVPTRVVLGDLDITGNFLIPWGTGHHEEDGHKQIEDFIAGTDKQFDIWWGSQNASSAGDLALRLNIRIQNVEVIGTGDETSLSVDFIAVKSSDNEPLEIYLNDGIERGITDRYNPTFEKSINSRFSFYKVFSKSITIKSTVALHHWKIIHSTVQLYAHIPNETNGFLEVYTNFGASKNISSTVKFWGIM